MRKQVYNLEFPCWCPAMTIHGYRFTRVEDYADSVARLQHLVSFHSELRVQATTGQHAITAYVDLPEQEDEAVLGWSDSGLTALSDVLLLLSIFTKRNVFLAESNNVAGVVLADPRVYQWGGVLICSLPYKESPEDPKSLDFAYDIGREEGLNQIYMLLRSEEWQRRYAHGYFLFLAQQAFHQQPLESAFIQCWTIWEHLFAVLNQHWLSVKQIRQLDASEKIAFILTEFALRGEIGHASRKRIRSLAEIRNRLIHFGRFPDREAVHDDAVLFIRLTEFVIAKILGLSQSNLFNTVERLEEFLTPSNRHSKGPQPTRACD